MRLQRPQDHDLDRDAELGADLDAFAPAEPVPGRRPLVLRRASGGELQADARAALDRAASRAGEPLSPAVRAKLERALGVDLSGVRVHTDAAADAAARAVAATAYTIGQHIYFSAGAYDPSSASGFRLITHEVVHTVQQGPSPQAVDGAAVSSPSDAVELEAERVADAVAAEPDAADTAAVADAIRPHGAEAPAARDAAVRDAQATARAAEAPGAPPLTIAYQESGRIMRDDAPAADGGGGDDAEGDCEPIKSKQDFDPSLQPACELHGAGCDGNHRYSVDVNVGFVPTVTNTMPSSSMGYDAIQAGGITLNPTVTPGATPPATAFGSATPKFTSDLTANAVGDNVVVTGTMNVTITWGTQSLGRTNVSSADDPVVTQDNFMTIYYDLVPQNGRTGKKDKYWVQAFTTAHEQVHIADYTKDSKTELTNTINWLQQQKVDVPGKLRSALGWKSAKDQVQPWLDQFATKVGQGVQTAYLSGGEAHAYGAGVGDYQTLADAIKNKGFSKGWDKTGKNKGGSVGDPNAPPTKPAEE